ncbi:MAG: aminotransferase class IV [Candidatus Zixiibacteriota bacterium]
MKTVTTINGRTVSRLDARVSVFDNALLYAEGLFETFLAIGNKALFCDEHLRRLHRGATVTGLPVPVSDATLVKWMTQVLRKHPAHVKKLRLTVTSGESARWAGKSGRPQVILSASPHRFLDRPYRLHVSPLRVDQQSVFRRIKTISYAIHAAAIRQAMQRRCDDALLLNEAGNLAEVTSANIFWVKKRKIYTPPLSAGCLEGVTRGIVMREAEKLGLSVEERNGTLHGLANVDEVFISSSLKLVAPVSLIIDGRRQYHFRPGPVTAVLDRHFRSALAGI